MAAERSYWLVKTEPGAYSWQDLLDEGTTPWDGVRNYQARNNLRAMKKGDLVLVYHSVGPRDVVGVTKVTREAYPDPTTDDDRWDAVDLKAVKSVKTPVTLKQIKADELLHDVALVKHSRLSVMPLTRDEFERILELGETRLPKKI